MMNDQLQFAVTNLINNLRISKVSHAEGIIRNIYGYMVSLAQNANTCLDSEKIARGCYLFKIQQIIKQPPMEYLLPALAQYSSEYYISACAKSILNQKIGMYQGTGEVSLIIKSNLLVNTNTRRTQQLITQVAANKLLYNNIDDWNRLVPSLEAIHAEEYV